MYFATLRKSHYVIIIEKTLYKVVNFQNELILYFELLALGSRGILLIWDSCGSIQNFDWLKSKHFYDNVFNTFKLFRLCHSKLCNLVISNSLTFLPLKIIKNFYPPTTSEFASGPMNVCDINQLILYYVIWLVNIFDLDRFGICKHVLVLRVSEIFSNRNLESILGKGKPHLCNTRFSLETWHWLGNFLASIFINDKTA